MAGLDLSLQNTGIAVKSADGSRFVASYGEKLNRDAGDWTKLQRLMRITSWITNILIAYDVNHVAIESMALGSNSDALTKLAEQAMMVRAQVYLTRRRIPTMMTPDEARKLVFGATLRQKASTAAKRKKLTKAAVADGLTALGIQLGANDDENDAIVLCEAMDRYTNRREQFSTAYQIDLFNRFDARAT